MTILVNLPKLKVVTETSTFFAPLSSRHGAAPHTSPHAVEGNTEPMTQADLDAAGAKYCANAPIVRKMLDTAESKALNAGFVDLEGAILDAVVTPLLTAALYDDLESVAHDLVYDFFKYKLVKENDGTYKITDPTVWMEHAKTFKPPANTIPLHDWPKHVQEMCEGTGYVHCPMEELKGEMEKMKAVVPNIPGPDMKTENGLVLPLLLPILTALHVNLRGHTEDTLEIKCGNTLYEREVLRFLYEFTEYGTVSPRCGMVQYLGSISDKYPPPAEAKVLGWERYLRFLGLRYERLFEGDEGGCRESRAAMAL